MCKKQKNEINAASYSFFSIGSKDYISMIRLRDSPMSDLKIMAVASSPSYNVHIPNQCMHTYKVREINVAFLFLFVIPIFPYRTCSNHKLISIIFSSLHNTEAIFSNNYTRVRQEDCAQ